MILDVEKLILKNTMKNINNSANLPDDPSKMTRKQRRQWYHENRKKYNLPRWGELGSLENNQ